jgi:hypothetical protein
MLALAEGLATQLGGGLDDFAFALDYTVGLLAISDPAWGAGALVKTPVSKSGTSLGELWLTAPATTGSVKWKLRHRHEYADGTYDVFFDVPNTSPGTTTLVVEVLSVEVLAGAEPGGDDLAVAIWIGDESLSKQLDDNDNKQYPGWKVARIVSSDPTIRVSLWDRNPPPAKYYDAFAKKCVDDAGFFTAPCPAGKKPVELGANAQSLKWDLETKQLVAGATAKSGESFVVFGDGVHPGRVKLRITQKTSAPRPAKAR